MDIEGANTSITMTFGAPASDEAGSPLSDPSSNSSLWLNYSSIVGASGETRSITVKLDNAVSEGTLTVQAASDAGNGLGSVGTAAASAITLSTTAQNIVTGIGSCYTGSGTSNGHQLTYSLSLTTTSSNYSNLVHNTNNQYTVTYTITDESSSN
ncbi:MAG: hypothetical protein MJA31_07390 [Clostridia bacterium]|nr:hypothetical protein [Clostridia bacterium]